MSEPNCTVCASRQVQDVLLIESVPVYCNVLWPDPEQARNAVRGRMRLMFCSDCGHLFNQDFDPKLMDYTADYENSLHYSPRFQEYAHSLVEELRKRYSLTNKKIVEIACGKGDFLHMLCSRGNNQGLGFDPSYESGRGPAGGATNVEVRPEYFGQSSLPWQADLVCCRHMLEHIQYPTKFLQQLRTDLTTSPSAALFFEVPNSEYTLRDLGIWDLIYEHCSYFWAGSLSRCFNQAGFAVDHVQSAFGNQYLCLDAHLPDTDVDPWRGDELAELVAVVKLFERNYQEKKRFWADKLSAINAAGKNVVVWGAGSKGVTFLNVLQTAEQIEMIVDLNPQKHGRFVPGTAQQVVPPEVLKEKRPDTVILMNAIYADEVRNQLLQLGLDAELLIA